MTDLINGRTQAEIKCALKRCWNGARCRSEKEGDCQYFVDCLMGVCRVKPMKDALTLIERLEAQQPKWISVKERLPEPKKEVLIRIRWSTGHVRYETAKYDEEYGDPWLTSNEDYYCAEGDPEVTHWAPLPEDPEVST